MPDHDDLRELQGVEDRDDVGGEVSGRVPVSGLRGIAVTAGIGCDEPQPTGDRASEEVPLPAGVRDAVEQERRRRLAGVLPDQELPGGAASRSA